MDPADFLAEETEQSLATGMVLAGQFRIEGLVGKGGMGHVYRAIDLSDVGDPNIPADQVPRTSWVALKVISPLVQNDEEATAIFREEVKKAKLLGHPNIVRVHDLREDAGLLFLSVELLEGHTLKTELARWPDGMPLQQVSDILTQVAEALHYAHHRTYGEIKGIVHRDVSPKNIFITDDGIRLIGFGIPQLLHDTQTGHYHTKAQGKVSTSTAGNAPYMSPERFVGASPDPRDDVYGFAVVVYEALTGSKPYQGDAIYQRPKGLYPPETRNPEQ